MFMKISLTLISGTSLAFRNAETAAEVSSESRSAHYREMPMSCAFRQDCVTRLPDQKQSIREYSSIESSVCLFLSLSLPLRKLSRPSHDLSQARHQGVCQDLGIVG